MYAEVDALSCLQGPHNLILRASSPWWSQGFKTSSPRANSAAANSWSTPSRFHDREPSWSSSSLYAGGLDDVTPGSSCIVNAYSSNHELLASSPAMSTTRRLVLHGVDAVGIVHALLLRIQALVLPIQALVFFGH